MTLSANTWRGERADFYFAGWERACPVWRALMCSLWRDICVSWLMSRGSLRASSSIRCGRRYLGAPPVRACLRWWSFWARSAV